MVLFQIQINGLITFGYASGDYTPANSPMGVGHNRISVYWADVDEVCGGNRITGDIYYRVSASESQSFLHRWTSLDQKNKMLGSILLTQIN